MYKVRIKLDGRNGGILEFSASSYEFSNGFFLVHDSDSGEEKIHIFPAHRVFQGAVTQEENPAKGVGYREINNYREQADKSPPFKLFA